MRPEDVGITESRVVLTARTGRHGLRDRLEKLGYTLSQDELNLRIPRFLTVADKKQEVFDEDLVAILHDEIHPAEEPYQLEYLHIYSGTSAIPTATVRLRVCGERREGAAIGDGPVDAVCKAISRVTANSSARAGALRDPCCDKRYRGSGRSDCPARTRRLEGTGTRRLHGCDRS